jgi:outer membrane receptor protein involved in Fe transport
VLAEYPELNLTAGSRRVNYRYNLFAPGAQARKDAFIARFVPRFEDLAPPATYPVNKTMSSAAYTNLQVGLWQNRLRFFAGGRYDNIEIDRKVITRATKAVSSALEKSIGQFSPQAGASFRLRPGLNLYGLYSQSVNPRFTTQPVRTAAAEALLIATFQNAGRPVPNIDALPWGEVLDPEEGQGWEAGVKIDSADGRRSITVGGFYIERVKVSTPDQDPILGPSLGFRAPGGLDRAQGLDVDFNLQLFARLQLLGGYTFIDSVRVKNENPLWVGKTLPNAAKHQGNIWARYAFREGRLKGASLGLGYTAVGDRRDD